MRQRLVVWVSEAAVDCVEINMVITNSALTIFTGRLLSNEKINFALSG